MRVDDGRTCEQAKAMIGTRVWLSRYYWSKTAIINMAHTLGQQVVAEGVESREELKLLKNRVCEVGQGYYFSRTLTASALAERVLLEKIPQPRLAMQ